ncbi:acyl-CoA reductase [Robertmurraya sp. FSL W8-0741]|uniref:acyl-CoA reductase n=1 Tax=Robertmurraya TaxID=2837507 RepID=UPI0010F60773|nr:acyl-CoA reductase [Robertmurraya siralis]
MRFYWPATSERWQTQIESVIQMKPLKPFDQRVVAFLQSLSKTILKDHTYRRYPELITLAYWLRRAHIEEMKASFLKRADNRLLRARGVALHFAPSNVDTIFVYSWVLSMLAGNNNILRVSGREQQQTDLLIAAILKEIAQYPEVASRTAIVTYEHNDEITRFLSERCHIRIVWGGDETVRKIRSIPLAPLATELVFPDRFSLSAFEAKEVINANESDMKEFVHQFYNDGFWFSQMACSSPRLIAWIGSPDLIALAQKRFWNELNDHLDAHLEELSAAMQVQKLTTGYLLSIDNETTSFMHQQNFTRVQLEAINREMKERHCGGGLFYELELPKLKDLNSLLDDKDQTLSYFGFTREALIDFANAIENRSIDRIVPVGQSLAFGGVWDGYDLMMHFTRELVIR